MIAVRIGPDFPMAVVGAPSYFARRAVPQTPHDLTSHECINLRLPTSGGLYSWPFAKDGRELKVRAEGKLVFNSVSMMLNMALAGLGLAHLPADVARPHIAEADLSRFSPTGAHLFQAITSITQAAASPSRPLSYCSMHCATEARGTQSKSLDFRSEAGCRFSDCRRAITQGAPRGPRSATL